MRTNKCFYFSPRAEGLAEGIGRHEEKEGGRAKMSFILKLSLFRDIYYTVVVVMGGGYKKKQIAS